MANTFLKMITVKSFHIYVNKLHSLLTQSQYILNHDDTATWNILPGSYCNLASHNYEIPTHLAKAVLNFFWQL